MITLSNPRTHLAAASYEVEENPLMINDITADIFFMLQNDKEQRLLGQGTYNVVIASRIQIGFFSGEGTSGEGERMLGLAVKLAMPEVDTRFLD